MSFTPGRYNLGPDHSIQITRQDNGATVVLDGPRSKFSSKHDDTLTKSSTIDFGGVVTGIRQPEGVSGSIDTEKGGSDFDQLVSFLDANYYSGGPLVYFTMTESIISPDRSTVNVNTYSDVQFHDYDRGSFEHNGIVKCAVQFFASTITPLS
jgi:hypothetical protein